MKFKVGDRVMCVKELEEDEKGRIGFVEDYRISDGMQFIWVSGFSGNRDSSRFILASKSKKEKQMKFLIYDTGCKNTALATTLKEAKDKVKDLAEDDNWTGDIQIFELKYKVETSVKLKAVK